MAPTLPAFRVLLPATAIAVPAFILLAFGLQSVQRQQDAIGQLQAANLQLSADRVARVLADRVAAATGPGSRALVLRDRASGVERLLWPNMLTFVGPRWSHDGTRVLIKGRSTANRWGMFTVDVATGAVSDAVLASDVDSETSLGAYQWSPAVMPCCSTGTASASSSSTSRRSPSEPSSRFRPT